MGREEGQGPFPSGVPCRCAQNVRLRGGLSPPLAGLGRAGHSALKHKAKQAEDSSHDAAAARVEAQPPGPRKDLNPQSSGKEVQSAGVVPVDLP